MQWYEEENRRVQEFVSSIQKEIDGLEGQMADTDLA